MSEARLVCDGMFGSLARALRVLGFDTAYAGSEATDDQVIESARKSGRVILTRDYEMLARAKKLGVDSLLVRQLPVEQQIILVVTHLGLTMDEARYFSRCSVCNGQLEPVDKAVVADKVPSGVLERHAAFTRCPDCEKVYWPGEHVESMEARMQNVVRELTENVGEDPGAA